MSAPWLTKNSVAELVTIKQDHPDGLDVFTAMAVAAHKQWQDVEFLLGELQFLDDGTRQPERLEKVRVRHALYAEAAKGRTDMIFP